MKTAGRPRVEDSMLALCRDDIEQFANAFKSREDNGICYRDRALDDRFENQRVQDTDDFMKSVFGLNFGDYIVDCHRCGVMARDVAQERKFDEFKTQALNVGFRRNSDLPEGDPSLKSLWAANIPAVASHLKDIEFDCFDDSLEEPANADLLQMAARLTYAELRGGQLIECSQKNTVNDSVQLRLNNAGMSLYEMLGDGNCLFRSFAFLMRSSQGEYDLVRKQIADHFRSNSNVFERYAQELLRSSIADHANSMETDGVWGCDLDIIGFCSLFKINAYVFNVNRTFDSFYHPPKELHSQLPHQVVFLSLHEFNHFNAVRCDQSSTFEEVRGRFQLSENVEIPTLQMLQSSSPTYTPVFPGETVADAEEQDNDNWLYCDQCEKLRYLRLKKYSLTKAGRNALRNADLFFCKLLKGIDCSDAEDIAASPRIANSAKKKVRPPSLSER